MSMTRFLLKGVAKIGLVGFTIKVIHDTNVFSTNSKETEKKFQKLVTEIVPGILDLKKHLSVKKINLQEGYNNTVDKIFTSINYFPEVSSNCVKSYLKFPILDEKKNN